MHKQVWLGVVLSVMAGAAVAVNDDTLVTKSSAVDRQRMTECQKQATSRKLKGAERGKFIQECTHHKPSDNNAVQRKKMQDCNAKAAAKKLKDEARRKFMTDCMMPGK